MKTELAPGMFLIDYTCAYCGKPGTAEASRDCPCDMLARFKKLLTCNECVASMPDRRYMEQRIAETVKPLILGAQLSEVNLIDLQDMLGTLLDRYAAWVCVMHRAEYIPDEGLAFAVNQKPELWMKILRHFENGVREAAGAIVPQPEMAL